jgi:hypothetical protein
MTELDELPLSQSCVTHLACPSPGKTRGHFEHSKCPSGRERGTKGRPKDSVSDVRSDGVGDAIELDIVLATVVVVAVVCEGGETEL